MLSKMNRIIFPAQNIHKIIIETKNECQLALPHRTVTPIKYNKEIDQADPNIT